MGTKAKVRGPTRLTRNFGLMETGKLPCSQQYNRGIDQLGLKFRAR